VGDSCRGFERPLAQSGSDASVPQLATERAQCLISQAISPIVSSLSCRHGRRSSNLSLRCGSTDVGLAIPDRRAHESDPRWFAGRAKRPQSATGNGRRAPESRVRGTLGPWGEPNEAEQRHRGTRGPWGDPSEPERRPRPTRGSWGEPNEPERRPRPTRGSWGEPDERPNRGTRP
jgi:hypothetical protein